MKAASKVMPSFRNIKGKWSVQAKKGNNWGHFYVSVYAKYVKKVEMDKMVNKWAKVVPSFKNIKDQWSV